MAIESRARLFEEVRRRLRVRQLPAIMKSPALSVPAAVGLWRPVILVPSAICDRLSENQWRDILVHESAHILRRDHVMVLLQSVIGAVFWMNPLVHLLNRRLVRAREEVCDNYVLSFTDGRSYGKTLLELAELIPPAGRLAFSPGLLGVRWRLQDRISGLLDPRRKATTRTTTFSAAIVFSSHLLLVGLLAAADTAKPSGGDDLPATGTGQQAGSDPDTDARWRSVAESIAEADRERKMRNELGISVEQQEAWDARFQAHFDRHHANG